MGRGRRSSKERKRKDRERRVRHERNVARNRPRPPIEDLSEEPPRRPSQYDTERAFRRFAKRTVDPFADKEEAEDALRRAFDEVRGLGGSPPEHDDPREAAQELAFQAMESSSRKEAEALAKRALALDPDCADALGFLAMLGPPGRPRVEALRKAVDAGERALGGAPYFEENRGQFWGMVETRPYMRVLQGLEDELRALGELDEAAEHYRAMLDLNPHDNQGVRHPLLAIHLEQGDTGSAGELLDRFPDDASAVFSWGRVTERFLSGDRREAARLFRAERANQHVVDALAGKPLKGRPDGTYIRGDESEAAYVFDLLGVAWEAHPEFREWVLEGALATTAEARQAAAESYVEPVAALLQIGKPTLGEEEPTELTALGPDHVPDLIRMATDPALSEFPQDSREIWAPVHAIRALGLLRAEEAVDPLLGLLYEDLDDDWIPGEVEFALEAIGPPAVPATTQVLEDPEAPEGARITAACVLGAIAGKHPESRDLCVQALVRQLERHEENEPVLNGFIIDGLAECRAQDALPLMKAVFDSGNVDSLVCGDWGSIVRQTRKK